MKKKNNIILILFKQKNYFIKVTNSTQTNNKNINKLNKIQPPYLSAHK